MHVLLLNQPFHPDVAATAQHAHDLGRYLVERGHRVTAVASRSIYGESGASLPRRENVDGIEVHRVGLSLFGKKSIFLRLIDFALFYAAAALKVLSVPRPDVIVPFTTPPLIVLVGVALKLIKRSANVHWVMDLYPDVLVACGVIGPRSLRARVIESINLFAISRTDRTVVLGRCMERRLIDRGIEPRKITVINVWGDVDETAPLPDDENPYRKRWNLEGRRVVMYSGNFGLGHDVRTMCEAALALRDSDSIRFVFVGGGKRKSVVEDFVAEHGLANCQCHPYQPRERLGQLLQLADVHLVSLIEPLAGVIVPSKTYGIMAAGRPTIFIGPPASEAARVLLENDCGLVVPIGRTDELTAAIERLAGDGERARHMGRRARVAMQQRFDRRHACAAWERVLTEAVGGRGT